MIWPRLDRLLDAISDPTFVWGSVGVGFLVLGVALLVLMLTRLGQNDPLRKCIVLSLLAHSLLAASLSTVKLASQAGSFDEPEQIRVVSIEGLGTDGPERVEPLKPWERFVPESMAELEPLKLDRALSVPSEDPLRQTFSDHTPLVGPASMADLPPIINEPPVPGRVTAGSPELNAEPSEAAAPIETVAASKQTPPTALPVAVPTQVERLTTEDPAASAASQQPPLAEPANLLTSPTEVPRTTEPLFTPSPEGPQRDEVELPVHAPVASLDSQPAGAAMQTPAPGAAAEVSRATEAGSVQSLLNRGLAPGDAPDEPVPSLRPLLTPPRVGAALPGHADREIPGIYRLRVAPDRARLAQQQGGTQQTEAAVNAALAWLAANQSADGRWDAQRHGAGREDKVQGQDRQGSGAKADTGMTGLALLAFLGAGHTHYGGSYQQAVAKGLEFLLRSQAVDGNLSGDADLYAAMYCHGMATIALSEAYALTGDEALAAPLRRAIQYTLSAQQATSGGWRYRPTDRQGDTSQFGWQLMALKSAQLAGLQIPQSSIDGMKRFLRSVASGPNLGLASYRPGERATPTMTAEALVCRHFLGMTEQPGSAREAGNLILTDLPGTGRSNLYYWYYATLAMHQLQGTYWEQWNAALRKSLVSAQRLDGPDAGSWDMQDMWGGYGGRVYTTAMGALCLEVYYRFLPLYDPATEAAQADQPDLPRR